MDEILENINEMEKKLKIKISEKKIIKTALTHSSYANEQNGIEYNERLEYLGDAVLELVISDYLFKTYSHKSEGELTKLRALIVCENSLHEIAQKWNLGNYILMSKGEELTGGRNRISILSDCVEAIIAAIYLDQGIEYVREFIIVNFSHIIEKAVKNKIVLDYKTKLQEILQKNGEIAITYNLLNVEGPAHRPKFSVELLVNNKPIGKGSGYSKKEAEQNVAKKIVMSLEEENE